MSKQAWKLSGEFMESCNCDYLCPCIYTNAEAEVTYDHCTSLQVYRIDEGSHGDIPLDGLGFAVIFRSGKVMADGNWVFAAVVDAAANQAQRDALVPIVSGEAGGPLAAVRETMVTDFRGVVFKPITFNADGLGRSATIPDVLSFAIDGVASKAEAGAPLYIDNADHPANRRVKETHVHAFGVDDDLVGMGNNGHFAPFRWAG